MSKHKNKNWRLSQLVVVLVLVLGIEIVAVMQLSKKQNGEVSRDETTQTVTETTPTTAETTALTESVLTPTEQPTEAPVIQDYKVIEFVDGEIQTPFCVLNYPEGLADHLLVVNTSQNPYTVEFYAVMEEKQEMRLFDISFGEGAGGNMGMVMTHEGEVLLNVNVYTLSFDKSWTEGEILTAYAMQDVVNELINQMAPRMDGVSDDSVVSQQPSEGGSVHNIEIDTPFCTLYYPARWKNYLRVDQEEAQARGVYMVRFYGKIDGCEDVLLFSLYFGGDEGEQLGAVMSEANTPVPVNLLMDGLILESMSNEDAEILYSMQEACNQLIERLPLLD